MTTISGSSPPSSLPPQTTDLQTNTPGTSATDGGSLFPFFSNLGFPPRTAAELGLHLPQNPGDSEAILAQVSQELEKTIGQARNLRDQAIADAVSAARDGILATTEALVTTGEKIGTEKAQITQKQAELQSEQTKLAKDQKTLADATDANAAAVSTFNYWNNQVATINQSTDPSGYANAVNQRTIASQNVTTTQNAKNAAQTDVDNDNAAIAQTEAEIAALQTALDQDTAIFNALESALAFILNQAAQAVQQMNTANPLNNLSDLGRDQVKSREFDKIFDGLRDIANSAEARDIQTAFEHNQSIDKDTIARLALAVIGLLPGAAPLPSAFDIGQSAFATATGSRLKIPL